MRVKITATLAALLAVVAMASGCSRPGSGPYVPGISGDPGARPDNVHPDAKAAITWTVDIYEHEPLDENDEPTLPEGQWKDSEHYVLSSFGFQVTAAVQDPRAVGTTSDLEGYPYGRNIVQSPFKHTIWVFPGLVLTSSSWRAGVPDSGGDYGIVCKGWIGGAVVMSSGEGVTRCFLQYPENMGDMDVGPVGSED